MLTLAQPADGEGRIKRQHSPPSRYGHVRLRLVPLPDAAGFEIEWATPPRLIPLEFRPEAERGIRDAAAAGLEGGGAVTGIRVYVTGGSFHDVDSSARDFHAAAVLAFREALSHAEFVRVV